MNSIPMRGRLAIATAVLLSLCACGGDSDTLAVGSPAAITVSGTTATATIADGSLAGSVNANTVTFLGIPYAQPPIGALRWMPPVAASAWTTTRDATAAGARCPQEVGDPSTRTLASQTNGSEDCLFLNVTLPSALVSATPGTKRAVMVWLHGGANAIGSGDIYDPTPLVSTQDVIVVTLNYRLGALGFLAETALDGEGHAAVNYGLMDQQLALAWVKANIATFGGDPDNVTVFGESAGGLDTFSQLVSPLAAGLFVKAIAESGAYTLDTPALATSEAAGAQLAAALGCTDASAAAACLRAATVDQILQNEGTVNTATAVYNQSTVDGQVLVESQRSALAAGRFNKVPVLQGANAHEGRIFTPTGLDEAGYEATLAAYSAIAGATPAQALAEYSVATYGSPFEAAAAATGDLAFACPSRSVSMALVAAGVTEYSYEFDDPAAGPLGATHGAEISYLMDDAAGAGIGWQSTGASLALSVDMRTYWAQFAKTGNPNASGVPTWSPYTAAGDNVQYLVPTGPVQDAALAVRHNCAFWAG